MAEDPHAVHHLRRRDDPAPDTELVAGDYRQLRRGQGFGDLAVALVCCPKCGALSMLPRREWEVDFDGVVSPPAKCAGCGMVAVWLFVDWVPEARGNA